MWKRSLMYHILLSTRVCFKSGLPLILIVQFDFLIGELETEIEVSSAAQ